MMNKDDMYRRINDTAAQVVILQEMRHKIIDQSTTVEEFEVAKMITAKIDELLLEREALLKKYFAA